MIKYCVGRLRRREKWGPMMIICQVASHTSQVLEIRKHYFLTDTNKKKLLNWLVEFRFVNDRLT